MLRFQIGIVVIALASTTVFADDVYLRGGGQITGQIVEQTEDSVTVDIGGGTMTAKMSSVVRIEDGVSPLQEYRKRAEAIPADDVEAWRELAKWASNRALSSQAAKAYSQVLAILPDDVEANEALGMVKLDGKWITEEESYRAKGFVEFEGQWMTPGERQSIQSGRRAQEMADRQANDAKIQAIEADQQADKKRADEERKESFEGNSTYWGWGAGPRYWPSPARTQPTNPADSPTGGR